GALARLTLAGRSVGDARIRRSLSGSVEMAALP
ncbi:prepilin-type cleavage/methylation domain-containing protein, partial [Escherichia coli]